MADPFALARDVLLAEANARATRAIEIREARAVILREFGPDGLARLEEGLSSVSSLESWANKLAGDACVLRKAAYALREPNDTP